MQAQYFALAVGTQVPPPGNQPPGNQQHINARKGAHLNIIVVAYAAQHVLWGLDPIYPCPHAEEAPDDEELHTAAGSSKGR